jgi:hypothetical protein
MEVSKIGTQQGVLKCFSFKKIGSLKIIVERVFFEKKLLQNVLSCAT